jgi:tetratricopeptide (TPR) repeat protein
MTATDQAIARAVEHFQAGDLGRAAKLCKRALKINPKDINALHLLGVVTYKAGKPKKAVAYLEDAIAGAGPDPELQRNLGFSLRDSDRPKEAAAAFARALELEPSDIVARFQLGALLGDAGDEDEALTHFAEVLRRDPGNSQAQYNHANALRKVGRYQEALESFAKAAELASRDPQVFVGWGSALQRLDQWDEAIEKYEHALTLDAVGDADGVFINLGNALCEIGQFNRARESFDRALALEPGAAEAIVGHALICDRRREFEKARDLIAPILEAREPPVSALLLYAGLAGRLDEEDRAIAILQAALDRSDLGDDQEQRICFSLGKQCDAAGRYDDAYTFYERANSLYAGDYDPQAKDDQISEVMESFPAPALEALPVAGAARDLPVFIVGMPRSGTTLVEQILSSHPRAAGAGELRDIRKMVAALPETLGCGTAFADIAKALTGETLDRLADQYIDALRAVGPDADRVTDKMPHNFEHLWFIRALFPEAPIIHCVRNPLDTCLSCFFQAFGGRHTYSRNLRDLAHHYIGYRKVMAHWKEALPGPMIDVVYEEVVADPEAQSRRLIDFCGMEWDPACLSFHENRRFVATASYDQVRRPIYASSAGRRVHYMKYLTEFKEILEVAGIY